MSLDCPTCGRGDAYYEVSRGIAPCNDPWHGDDHLRRKHVSIDKDAIRAREAKARQGDEMTIADKCPNCHSRRREDSPFPCSHDWHKCGPEMMFSFPMPAPQYSKTVTETELKRAIEDARRAPYAPHPVDHALLALAAERMIENEKAPKPKPKPLKLNPAESIRRQIAVMLEDIGLNPDRFLIKPAPDAVQYTKEPSNVCFKTDEPADKAVADKAARELAQLIKDDLGVDVDISPILLRLWLIERWDAVAKLAHKIHGSA